jgi:GntR family transcriptional regulator
LEFRRGRGISVAGTPDAVINKARELIELARHHGYSVDEVINIIDGVT